MVGVTPRKRVIMCQVPQRTHHGSVVGLKVTAKRSRPLHDLFLPRLQWHVVGTNVCLSESSGHASVSYKTIYVLPLAKTENASHHGSSHKKQRVA